MQSSNDQPGKQYSNQNATSYAGHPGYNQKTGIYSYGSGQDYQLRTTATSTSAYTKQSSYTIDSCTMSTNGESFATQYATDPNVTSTANSYFNLPYGTATFLENGHDNPSTGSMSHNLSYANPIGLHPMISDNKNSTTYMQSNSQISTTTTRSAETRDMPHASYDSCVPQQSTADNNTTESTARVSNIDHMSGLSVTISDLTISAAQRQQ
ncbi:uncharacterized protein LOC119079538 [Bradysia coprophila]|uniref:uncharacterized protein LOC119079538 n=1 Tax=Bradysia coprophila TaxID=38358 RepID=UPI00187DD5E3|nr:uncharacterized protein LOC119079538 [Bradysia coprophila]